MTASIFWFRRDLRLADNPGLLAAIQDSSELLPVYIHSPDEEGLGATGTAGKWWLHHSLTNLQTELRRRGSDLLVIKARSAATSLLELCQQHRCRRVVWARLYEPGLVSRDKRVADKLNEAGIETLNCQGNIFAEPDSLHNQQGKPYRVFTPFWNAVAPMLYQLGPPIAAPLRLPPLPQTHEASDPSSLALTPGKRQSKGYSEHWTAGEKAGHASLEHFLQSAGDYASLRDHPAKSGTSKLSPHLHFGELSLRQIVHALRYAGAGLDDSGHQQYLRQLCWREFARHLLWHFPDSSEQPLDKRFNAFPWRRSKKDLQRWQLGDTGIPIIDAGMRELRESGWMHNRVRMLTASFLTKHLRLPWQAGAEWFREHLVDADLANNSLGWQWTAGCGADAAPYFRVFNPVLQGNKFDPNGDYARRWVPELSSLPNKAIHSPWIQPDILKAHGLRLGRDYPSPMVDLARGREEALAAYQAIKQT